MRNMISYTLKIGGFDVTEAIDGEDGASKLKTGTFDLIISDLNMPKVDGIEFIKNARNLPNGKFIPILVLTTESQQERKMEGKIAGATGWIVKPFNPDQLINVVKKVLGC
ncbi:MAG: response regulator [Candidatus Riflebacteria bacterium]|nr:response regulator [Candidatus Riflebacteria bacterium]